MIANREILRPDRTDAVTRHDMEPVPNKSDDAVIDRLSRVFPHVFEVQDLTG